MSKKLKKTPIKKLSQDALKRELFKVFKREPKARYSAKQLIKKLRIPNNHHSVSNALELLAKDNKVIVISGYKYKLNRDAVDVSANKKSKKSYPKKDRSGAKKNGKVKHEGKVDMTRSGSAFILIESLEDDVFVPAKRMNGALDGDKVLLEVFPARGGKRRAEGSIIKIIERSNEFFIGTFRKYKSHGLVVPDNLNVAADIHIGPKDMLDAKDNEKVVVKITQWPKRTNDMMIGRITTVLGEPGTNDIEMQSILINNGFNLTFPDEVIKESKKLSKKITKAEIEKRRDIREITTFTIDPDTAKDFDDALSIRPLVNDEWEIGVHIADVSHYVQPDTALDKEAYLRSTSVYLVDRVLPMLPETLSNELCSLRPHEDKLTYSAIFLFGKNGKVKDRWFGRTVIHSDRRFTYEEAQEVLETGKGDFATELKQLNKFAYKLRKEKFKKGAIAFESPEVKFKLDEAGKPIDVYTKERKDAHMLIEDYMLLANKEVAAFMAKKTKGKEVPYIYRVHDTPNPEKLEEFSRFALELGFKMEIDTPKQVAESFNKLSAAAKENDLLKMLEPIAIRCMSKAAYSSDNIGHYGLAFEFYSHFTSPIRRYSDVIAHRLLEKNIYKTYITDKEHLEGQCKHISSQERNAMTAERESIKYKQVEYVMDQVGNDFDGVISGIIDRGFFVELSESKAEGMVGFDTLDEPYEIEEGRLKAVGKRSKRVLKMGDTVRVRITDADLTRRQIEMELLDEKK